MGEAVSIPAGAGSLSGDVTVPPHSHGLVIFAHGSGSSRHSPRNHYVAGILNRRGFATLLLDLLTESEEQSDRRTAAYRFDIALLAGRLVEVTDWTLDRPETGQLGIGYFGASTGAAAALVAASQRKDIVQAIVSRGGRPDLASTDDLQSVVAPTLFIVGGNDLDVLELNRKAASRMRVPHEISIVEGAGHLFEEQGALARVSALAAEWFRKHLRMTAQRDRSHARPGGL